MSKKKEDLKLSSSNDAKDSEKLNNVPITHKRDAVKLLIEIFNNLNKAGNRSELVKKYNLELKQTLARIQTSLEDSEILLVYQSLYYKHDINILSHLIRISEEDADIAELVSDILSSMYHEHIPNMHPLLRPKDYEAILQSKNKDLFIHTLEKRFGKEEKQKCQLLVASRDYFRTLNEYFDLFSLPLHWDKESVESLLKDIDSEKTIPSDQKQILKKIFIESHLRPDEVSKTSAPDKRKKIETLWKKYKDEPLSMRLFGHIHNDPNLQGSTIQGMDLMSSLNYLNGFIKNIETQSTKVSGLSQREQAALIQDLKPFREKLEACSHIEQLISNCLNNPKTYSVDKDKLVADLEKNATKYIIASLKKNKSVLFPGGWIGKNRTGGHAMLYELLLINDKLVFIVHNMGAGIDFHPQKLLADHTYYSSIAAFEVTGKIEEIEKKLTENIKTLLKPNYEPIVGYDAYDENKVYDEIRSFAAENGMAKADVNQFTSEWTIGQLSGTCAFRVFESYLNNFPFKENNTAKNLKYEILRNSLEEFYFANLERLDNVVFQRQMNFALQNFSLILHRLRNEHPSALSAQRVGMGMGLIEQIRADLALAVKNKTKLKFSAEKRPPKLTKLQGNHDNPKVELKEIKTDSKEIIVQPMQWANKLPDKINQKNVLEVLENSLKIANRNKEGLHHTKLIQDIEELFDKLPLHSGPWDGMEKPKIRQTLDLLHHLEALYTASVSAMGIDQNPKRRLLLTKGQFVSFYLFAEYYKDNNQMIGSMADLMIKKSYSSFYHCTHSPHFLSLNADFREEIQKINEEFSILQWFNDNFKRPPIEGDSKDQQWSIIHELMNEFINADPTNKKRLIEFCNRKIEERLVSLEPDNKFSTEQARELKKASDEQKMVFILLHYRHDLQKQFPELPQKLSDVFRCCEITDLATVATGMKIVGFSYPDDPLRYPIEYSLEKDDKGNVFCKISKETRPNMYSVGHTIHLSENHNKFHDETLLEILKKRSGSSNEIQIKTLSDTLTSHNALLRALKNLRLNSSTQIIETLDFMKREFFRLADPDIQQLVYISLFELPLLEKQIEQTPETLLDLIKLIESGIKDYVQNNKLQPGAFFFFKLSSSLAKLLDSLVVNHRLDKQKLETIQQNLARLNTINKQVELSIDYYEKEASASRDKKSDKEISGAISAGSTDQLLPLHLFKIINYTKDQTIYSAKGAKVSSPQIIFSPEVLERILDSILYINNHSSIQFRDIFIENLAKSSMAEMQNSLHDSIKLMLSKPNGQSDLQQMLNRLTKKYNSGGAFSGKWEMQYPWFLQKEEKTNSTLIAFNFLNGKIIGPHSEKIPFPVELSQQRILKDNFKKTPAFCNASPDKTVFEFVENGISFRISKSMKTLTRFNIILQAQFTVNGQKKWFQYSSDHLPIQLPRPMLDQNFRGWIAVEPKPTGEREILIVDAETKTPRYYFDGQMVRDLRPDKIKSAPYLLNSESLDELLQVFPEIGNFEDKKHIVVWRAMKPSEIKIELPRYNLSFSVAIDANGNYGDIIWEQDRRYKLNIQSHHEFIPNFRSHLWLVPSGSEKVAAQVLIPEQRFIATIKEENEYHELELDKSSSLKEAIIKNAKKFNQIPDSMMNLKNSEQYTKFAVSESGLEIIPDSISSQLSLIQILLAKHQPLLAYHELVKILNQDKPFNEMELDLLRVIVADVPAKFPDSFGFKDYSEKAKISTPEYTAVRLLALSLLVKQKNQFKSAIKPMADEDSYGLQKLYKKECQKNLMEFLKEENLSRTILDLFIKYNKTRIHIPANMLLNDNKEELELLRYMMNTQKDIPPDVHYRRRVLELQRLKFEQNQLLALKVSMKGELNAELQLRLQQITQRIAQYPKVELSLYAFNKEAAKPLVAKPRDMGFWSSFSEAKVESENAQEKPTSQNVKDLVMVFAPSKKEEPLAKPKVTGLYNKYEILIQEKEQFSNSYNQQKIKIQMSNAKLQAHSAFPNKEGEELAWNSLQKELRDEYQQGLIENWKLNARHIASIKFVDEILKRDNGESLAQKLNKNAKEANKELDALKSIILNLTNQEPSDPALKSNWRLKKFAKLVTDLSFEEILRLFLKGDKAIYKAKTALNDKEIEALQQKIFEYLILATEIDYQGRLSEKLAIIRDKDKKLSTEELQSAKQQIGMLLSMKRAYSPSEHPEILLFEYLDKKIIYPEQFHYLETLMRKEREGFESKVIKLIMGGGKSKVIQPLLSLKKATGTNLVALVVPKSLFEMNRADLNATTMKLFGCQAHAFQFDETIEYTPAYLLSIYRKLKSTMQNREYLITTKESLQSLESKYINLLRYGNVNDPNTIKSLRHLSDILRIFKYQGDILIDEVDSTLDVRKQLIVPSGKSRRLTREIATVGVQFFQFLDSLSLTMPVEGLDKLEKKKGEGKKITLRQIALRTEVPSMEQWRVLLESLAKEAITNKQSPLYRVLQPYFAKGNAGVWDQNAMVQYLLGRSPALPAILSRLNPKNVKEKELLETIAFYKLELQATLPLKSLLFSTLSKKKNENYGLSRETRASELAELAIPYSASDTPSEGSRFKNPIETLNFTIQLHYGEPLSEEIMKRMIKQYKLEHEQELKQGQKLGAQSASSRFLAMTGPHGDPAKVFHLQALNLDNPMEFKAFYEQYKNNTAVKQHCMVNHLLTYIEENEEYLTSDAHNFCGMARSVQGMTGTDWNKRCFPKYMDTANALQGSDGQVIDYLLRNAAKPHLLNDNLLGDQKEQWIKLGHSEKNLQQKNIAMALRLLDTHPIKKKFHAWIDLGAHFRGIPNREVAAKFRDYFQKQKETFSHIRFVLYFEGDGKLYALPKEGGEKISLEETSADYIQAKLNITPEQYFVYYDQRRTTGTDLKQAQDAHAFVSLGADTLKRDLLQASMRMRELREGQRVEFVVPKECQDTHPGIKEWSVKSIIDMCQENETHRLMEDHFRATQQEMKQKVRNSFMNRILKTRDIVLQKKLIEHFHQAFFNRLPNTLFELYGGIAKPVKVKELLTSQMKTLIAGWVSMLKEAKLKPSELEIQDFTQGMISIIEAAVPFCRDKVQETPKDLNAQQLGEQVQVEAQAKAEVEAMERQEQEQELNYSAIANAAAANEPYLGEDLFDLRKAQNRYMMLDAMTSTAASTKSGQSRVSSKGFNFSNNIGVSKAFAHTVNAQSSLMNAYKKNNVFFLVQQTEIQGRKSFNFLLLTPEEAVLFAKNLNKSNTAVDREGKREYWIETAHHTLYAGKRPMIGSPAYKQAIDEIAFFNGDLDILYHNLNNESWIKTAAPAKLQYLERVIQPLHQDKANLMKPLTAAVHMLIESKKEVKKEIKPGVSMGVQQKVVPKAPNIETKGIKPPSPHTPTPNNPTARISKRLK